MGENSHAAVPGGLTAGSRLAGYLLEEQIGRGGMAAVFLATDERLNRQVALKVLAPELAADHAFRQRFIRESQAAAAVDDPHIIPVYEAGEAGGVLFIAMRLVRGGDAGALVRQVGPLPPGRVVAIISPVAAALDAAHESGLVHRDVKPTNMLVDARPGRPEHIYLSDFGLSKTQASVSLTGTGQFLGTLDYMAPEQIEGQVVDGRADQYALASTAFELLSGAPPFQRPDAMAVLYARLSQPPPLLSSRRPGLPAAADAVFARALSKAPADRYPTCRDFADALRGAFGIGRYDADPGPGADSGRSATELAFTPAAASQPVHRAVPPPGTTGAATPRPPGAAGPAGAFGAAGRPDSAHTHAYLAGAGTTRPDLTGHPGQRHRRGARWAAAVISVLVLAGSAAALIAIIAGRAPSSSGPPHYVAASCGPAGRSSSARVNWLSSHVSRLLHLGLSQSAIVEGIAVSPAGTTVAVSTLGGVTYLVNTSTGQMTGELTDPGSQGLLAVAFNCNGKLLATADRNGSTYLWNLAAGPQAVRTLSRPGSTTIRAVAFSPDGKLLAAGDDAGRAYLWSIAGGAHATSAGTLTTQAGAIQAIAFNPAGTLLAAGGRSGSIYLWPIGSGKRTGPPVIWTDPGSSGVQALAFDPGGTQLASGDGNASTYLWPLPPSEQPTPRTLTDPGTPGDFGTVALAFSPDGTTLAAAGYGGQTYLWNAASGNLVAPALQDKRVLGRQDDVQAVVFVKGGTALVTGDTQGDVYLWSAG
jgi:WD40 repeat protein